MFSDTALYEWVKKNKKQRETFAGFFMRVLDEKNLCREFLSIVLDNPRDNKITYRKIMNGFLSPPLKNLWYTKYTRHYQAVMRTKWEQAKRIEDVLKIIPNFTPWALKDKFGSIRIGSIPKCFGDEKAYHGFLEKVYNSRVMSRYREFKALEQDLNAFSKAYPEVKKIDWTDLQARSRFLSELLNQIIGHPFFIVHLGHRYAIRYLCNPFSCKMVFQIESDTNKKYILKMQAHQIGKIDSDAKRKEAENHAIRADSPYSNALMEFYLKLNKCPHAPDILYYTDRYEAVLYHAQKGKEFSCRVPVDFKTFNHKYLKDANRLGIYVNDISVRNFIWGNDEKIKIIDIGHASFANPLTQGIPGLTFSFGNLCGQDYLTLFGAMSMED